MPYHPKTGKISLLFVNNLNEEVLVKSKDGEIGFFGVFIQPQQEYRWEWADSIDLHNHNDTTFFQTTFDFFKEGQAHDFTEYISSYTFSVDVFDSLNYADTCYIN